MTTTLPFCKFHGFGNDYIVLEREKFPHALSVGKLALDICHRHTGAGSDGLAILSRSEGPHADFTCEIVNPDGSIAAFSGNGTRCAVAYLHYAGLWSARDLRLKTLSGIKNYRLTERVGDTGFWFDAEIGMPQFASDAIPVSAGAQRDRVVSEPIDIGGQRFSFSAVKVGNPIACIFVDDLGFDWRGIGREMERHEMFPERVNAVFVKVLDRGNIELRIWERGAGETSASGSCSSGAAVLSAFLLKTGRTVRVHSPGGVTTVVWRDDDEIVLTGRADLAYCGEWPVDLQDTKQ